MSNIVILGAQWGDESKGKLTDVFAGDADIVARYQGCLLYTSPSPRDGLLSRMPSSA